MKRGKKWLLFPLALALFLGLLIPVAAADEAQLGYVTDTAGLLSGSERHALETAAAELSDTFSFGVYVITVDDYRNYNPESVGETAAGIYHQYTLGEGDGRNGALLLLSMEDRDYATYFYGPQAEYAFNSYGREAMEDSFLSRFGEDDWYGGFMAFYSVCGDYLARAAAGNPVRANPTTAILITLLASWLVALLVCTVLKAKMKSVRKQATAAAYVTPEGLNLTQSVDHYTHTTRTRRKIERSSGSGSGGSHSYSSGGGSGRSGKF